MFRINGIIFDDTQSLLLFLGYTNLQPDQAVISELKTLTRKIKLPLSTVKSRIPKHNLSRKQWLVKVQAARDVEEEYFEYIPLTEAEKNELFN